MNCKYCNKSVNLSDNYCNNCGKPIIKNSLNNNNKNAKSKSTIIIIAVIIILLVSLFSFAIFNFAKNINKKNEEKFLPAKTKLDELYKNYEIIEKCDYWNDGDDNNSEILLRIDNDYVLFDYDYDTEEFYSSFNGLNNGKNHIINQIIKNNISVPYYSHLIIDKDLYGENDNFSDYYNYYYMHISLIINESDLLSDTFIKDLENLYNEMWTMYDSFIIRLYVADSVDITRAKEYDLFLTSQIAYRCDAKFNNKFSSGLVKSRFVVNFGEYKKNEENVYTADFIKEYIEGWYYDK